MKSIKLNYILLVLLFCMNNTYSQSYYPKLNNLFLDSSENESIFNNETNFFRVELRKCFNKLFYANLQTSNAGNSYNSSAFYSMKIIPRFIFETDLFNSEIKLKFNVEDDKSEFPSFPVIYNENNFISDDDKKEGKGNLTLNKGTVSLQFSNSLISSNSEDTKSDFLIEKIDYTHKNNIFEIELIGEFLSDVKIKKIKIVKNLSQTLKFLVENKTVTISIINKDKETIIFEKIMKD